MSVAWKVLTRKIKFLLSYRQLSFFVHWAKFHASISPQLGRVCLSASVVVRITSFHKSMWCDDQLISPHLSWTRLKYVASSRCFIKALCLVLYLSVTPKHKEENTWQNRPLWLKSFGFPIQIIRSSQGNFHSVRLCTCRQRHFEETIPFTILSRCLFWEVNEIMFFAIFVESEREERKNGYNTQFIQKRSRPTLCVGWWNKLSWIRHNVKSLQFYLQLNKLLYFAFQATQIFALSTFEWYS